MTSSSVVRRGVRWAALLWSVLALTTSCSPRRTDQAELDELKRLVNTARLAAFPNSTIGGTGGSRDDCITSKFVRWHAEIDPGDGTNGSVAMDRFVAELAKLGFEKTNEFDLELARAEAWDTKKKRFELGVNGRKDKPLIRVTAQTGCTKNTKIELNFS
jgi:hypothetical protein